jgi:hypothetical protein
LYEVVKVPLAATIDSYINVVIRLMRIQHGIVLHKPLALIAWVKRMGQAPRPRAFKQPVDKDVLLALVTRDSASLATRTAAMLAYFMCARLGNLVEGKVAEFQPAFALRRRDVRYLSKVNCFEIILRRGKTNVYNVQDSRFLLPAKQGASFCPVTFLRAFLDRTAPSFGGDGDLPLLRHADSRNVTRSHVVKLLRMVAEEMGVDPSSLGGHSFRISAATHMAEDGLDLEIVQVHGHWASLKGMLRYLRWSTRTAERVTDALQLTSSGQIPQLVFLNEGLANRTRSTPGRRHRPTNG